VEQLSTLHREREAPRADERVPPDAKLRGGSGCPREDAVEHDGVGRLATQEISEERREKVNNDGERPSWEGRRRSRGHL